MQKVDSVDRHLNETLTNLNSAIENSYESINMLNEQHETTIGLSKKIKQIDDQTKISENILDDMKNPCFTKRKNIANIGKLLIKGEPLIFSGYVLKRGITTKRWNRRYFVLDIDQYKIDYKTSEKSNKILNTICLGNSTINVLAKGEKDSNGTVCNKDNCFEIVQFGVKHSDTIHISNKYTFFRWLSIIKHKLKEGIKFNLNNVDIKNELSDYVKYNKSLKRKERYRKIDIIHDQLDELGYLSSNVYLQVNRDIDNFRELNSFISHVNDKILELGFRIKMEH